MSSDVRVSNIKPEVKMNKNVKDVLVIGAHTDDEHGMSGTIYKLVNAGHRIHMVITTSDLLIHPVTGSYVHGPNFQVRKDEMTQAAKKLGIHQVYYLDEPDGKLEVTKRVKEKFNTLIDTIPTPDVVFTHSPIDIHPDHRHTASLAMNKFFQSGVNIPFYLYALNSATWRHENIMPQTLGFYPTHYCSIPKNIVDIMKEADACHVSQNGEKVNSMFRGVEASLRGRGAEISKTYAEGFMYITRYGKAPSWLTAKYLRAVRQWQRGIPFKVVPEAIGQKK